MIPAILFIAAAAAGAQVVPAVNGPARLPVSGTLRYDLRYSQTVQRYAGYQGDGQSSAVSGEITYANLNTARPFNLTYSGGDMWNIDRGSGQAGVFQHLMVSEGVLGRDWSLNLSDDVSYLPQAPTSGFSGIPGIGSLPAEPAQPSQPILTLNTRSLYNTVAPSFSHSLDHATTLGINGSYNILRFPDGNGLSMDDWQLGPQLTRRLNALNSITAQYFYSRFSYPDYTITMGTQSAMFGYQRSWNRRFSTSVSAGPEWIQGSDALMIPSSTSLSLRANASYQARQASATVSYSQATSGGAGIATEIGVRNHDVTASISRDFGRSLTMSGFGSYLRTQGLQQAGSTDGKTGGASATRRIGQSIIVFVNYSAIQQSSSTPLPANAISGLSQVIGFGIGYSPRELHFKK